MNGGMELDFEENGQPYLEIVEQPQQRGFRFRYECEGPSHGGLQGASSERYRKTVPTVRIKNYTGAAKMTVSLVTDEPSPKPHAHKLVGKNCTSGACTVEVKPGTAQIAFPNLCIQHVTRRKAGDVLEERIMAAMILAKQMEDGDFSSTPQLSGEERDQARAEAQNSAKTMQLNVVRLCFQAFLQDGRGGLTALPSVTSDPIYDSKAPGANALKICRMDKYSGCCTGNDEVFLLCEKVQKDDIMVRFVEQDVGGGNVLWEAYGHFSPLDVHRQFAIVFKTPEYRDLNITKAVNVLVQLQRKSDGETSDPKSFTYYPRSYDPEFIDRKRQKILPRYPGSPGRRSPYDYNPPSAGGGSDSNSSNSNGVNGVQNGGSIPNFNDLKFKTAEFKNFNIPTDRRFARAQRSLAQYTQQSNVAMFTSQTPDILTNSTEFVYEEVSNMSPPSQQVGPTTPPLLYSMGPQTSAPGSVFSAATPSPYNQMMSGSPQSIMSGGLSPQHTVMQASPQSMQAMSPQGNLGSPLGMGDTSQGGIQFGGQMLQATSESILQASQFQSGMHMTAVTSMHGQPQNQPLQVPSDIETDLLADPDMLYQLQQQAQGYSGSQSAKQMQYELQQQYGTCAFQARGTQYPADTDLQDVMSIIEGFDEVDAALVKQPGAYVRAEEVKRCQINSKEEMLVGRGSRPGIVVNPAKKAEPMIGNTAKVSPVAKEVLVSKPKETIVTKVTETESKPEVKISAESRPAVKEIKTCEVQTDMDPMLKLAMKTSEALQYYAGSGDIRSLLMVQRFLMAVQDQDGDLPLHTALINGKYEVFQNILDVMVTLPDAYTRINAYNFHHQTPLHLAVITDQPAAVDLLIRAGADPTLIDRSGYTPAHLAVLYTRTDCLKNLLKYLRRGVTKEVPFPELNIRCFNGYTPAHLAAQSENLEAMKLLVYGRADIDLPDGKSGQTPLHHAVENDELSLAAYLILQAGAKVNTKRFDGNTALHIACGRGNVGMVALLMAGGADPDIENDEVIEVVEGVEMRGGDSVDSRREKRQRKKTKEARRISEEKDEDTAAGDATVSVTEEQQKVPEEGLDEVDAIRVPVDPAEERPQEVVVSEESGESSGDDYATMRGLVPADFADNNEKILRVLNGEPYSSLESDEDGEGLLSGTTDRLASLSLSSRHSSGIGSLHSGGDLYRLNYPDRVHLSQILDINQGWVPLAERLGLTRLFHGQIGSSSPTRLLFDSYEAGGGTIARLVQALQEIKRPDCVNILKKAVTVQPEQAPEKIAGKDPVYDSGVEESLSKASSPEHRGQIA
ncbi:NFKB1-like protein [Mya arenaria]|uniref:NFKB1-like protein n=1 Tax=Mya arenaria TaxID=6604 RepID=A0ABY7DMJ6_MYAAR|nr:nuclear factor NF-kappa-B p100 subunit-like [Mya arenaria]WAQ97288.1 NFKB1-like protein [Mya arenaria]